MNKLVIQTQYKENYAAHNEDYVHGVSEPYWKFKGGETFVVSCSFAVIIIIRNVSFWGRSEVGLGSI